MKKDIIAISIIVVFILSIFLLVFFTSRTGALIQEDLVEIRNVLTKKVNSENIIQLSSSSDLTNPISAFIPKFLHTHFLLSIEVKDLSEDEIKNILLDLEKTLHYDYKISK